MGNDLKTLVEQLVNDSDSSRPAQVVPASEVIESDSDEAWNDFQDSQVAYEKSFQKSQQGAV